MDTFTTLRQAILTILPSATFGEDNDGQIVIYTDLKEGANDALVPFPGTDDVEGPAL